ncbi:MAG TPA: hypothetical protein VMZ53_05990 [Kofleriaceae bacterium]|nr:hypothetical protein [Kofleriaceae bacterium]
MKRRLVWGALFGAVLGACISIPPYAQKDAGGDGAPTDGSGSGTPATVTYMDDGSGGGVVVGPFFNMHFAGGTKPHYPDAISIDNLPVLGHSTSAACAAEDEHGVAFYPSGRVSPNGPANVSEGTMLDVVWRGPAIVKVIAETNVRIDGSDSSANAVTRHPTITSRYTIHPDGKVFRYDTIEGGTGAAITPTSMSCFGGTPGQFIATSFSTWQREAGSHLYVHSGTTAIDTPVPEFNMGATDVQNRTSACLDYGQRQVAFGWYDLNSRIRAPTADTLAFVYDYALTAESEMGAADYWTRSMFMLGRGNSCTTDLPGIYSQVRAWEGRREMLNINGLGVEIANDGIYGGEADPGSTPGIWYGGDPVTLTGTISIPFAVWLIMSPAADDIVVEKADAQGPFYQKQRDASGTNWVIWFRDPLSSGQSITVRRAP